jgi:hypothetical protein
VAFGGLYLGIHLLHCRAFIIGRQC